MSWLYLEEHPIYPTVFNLNSENVFSAGGWLRREERWSGDKSIDFVGQDPYHLLGCGPHKFNVHHV